jgi:transcriptional regulator with XRE-family HTH domain
MMRRKAKRTRLLDDLARHLSDRRRVLGITQEQLSEKSGLSTNYIARLETAGRVPSLASLILLSEALEIEVSRLLASNTESPWIEDADEIARMMHSLDEQDSRFVRSQVQSIVQHIRALRGTSR